MQQNYRNIIKFGELQIKTLKKGGTLLKKKKYIFEEEKWVALCVHNNKIPFLEWYSSKDEVFNHEPNKVQDLLDCMFVNTVFGDDKRFIISFCDEKRSPLEFCTVTSTQCSDWVTTINFVLKKLNCLGESENLYLDFSPNNSNNYSNQKTECTSSVSLSTSLSSCTINTNVSPAKTNYSTYDISMKSTSSILKNEPSLSDVESLINDTKINNLTDVMKANQKPVSLIAKSYEEDYSVEKFSPRSLPLYSKNLNSTPPNLRNALKHEKNESEELLPPLPPRKLQQKCSKTQNISKENLLNTPITFHKTTAKSDIQYDFPTSLNTNNQLIFEKKIDNESDIYNQFSENNKNFTQFSSLNLSQELETTNYKTRLSVISLEESQTVSSSDSRTSSNNLIKGSSQFNQNVAQYDFASSPPLFMNNLSAFNSTFREALNKPKTISLLLTICVEHIAFVEVGNKIWIAGWNPEKDNYLKNLIHFGDEILQVGDELLKNVNQIPSIFFTQSIPGTPIELKIRSIPYGSVYSLTKPFNAKQSLGIILYKKKNTIASIEEKSLSWLAKVPNQLPPYIYGSVEVPSVITELEGIPLNPFAKNEQFFLRIKKFAQGSSFNIIIHPLDLVKLIKTKLKELDNYKKFLHNF